MGHATTTASHIAHTSLRTFSWKDWYFDGGCSRHMTREKNYLKEVKTYTNNSVIFGDSVKCKIVGKRRLMYLSIPNLKYVLLVEGLMANLISIAQLYDQELFGSTFLNALSWTKIRRKSWKVLAVLITVTCGYLNQVIKREISEKSEIEMKF